MSYAAYTPESSQPFNDYHSFQVAAVGLVCYVPVVGFIIAYRITIRRSGPRGPKSLPPLATRLLRWGGPQKTPGERGFAATGWRLRDARTRCRGLGRAGQLALERLGSPHHSRRSAFFWSVLRLPSAILWKTCSKVRICGQSSCCSRSCSGTLL